MNKINKSLSKYMRHAMKNGTVNWMDGIPPPSVEIAY